MIDGITLVCLVYLKWGEDILKKDYYLFYETKHVSSYLLNFPTPVQIIISPSFSVSFKGEPQGNTNIIRKRDYNSRYLR